MTGAVPIDGIAEYGQRIGTRTKTILNASRKDADVSQSELATMLGWTRNMVANLESGRRVVRLTDFLLVARALRIEPERLLRRILQW
jgi:transcriptional regulator with XRE-family HTH domain